MLLVAICYNVHLLCLSTVTHVYDAMMNDAITRYHHLCASTDVHLTVLIYRVLLAGLSDTNQEQSLT